MSEIQKISFDDKTTIFDYFKEHHSLLIACVSGVVAILSFYVSLLSYISLRMVLDEYAILPELVKVNGQGNTFYKTIAAVIFYVALISIQNIFRYYIHRNYVLLAADVYCLLYHGTYSDETVKKEQRKTYHSTILCILPYAFILAFICLLYELSNNKLSWSVLSFIIIIVLVSIACAYGSERKNKKRYNITTIKNRVERIKTKEKKQDEDGIGEDDKMMMKDITEIADSLSKKNIITNDSVIMSIAFIVMAMVFSFFSVITNSTMEAQSQKKFPLYYENEKAFAVVYQNEQYYVLEEIKTNGDDLIIYRNKQRYLSSDDITVEYKTFKNVTKMEWEEERTEIQIISEETPVSEEMIDNDVEKIQQNTD